MLTYSASGFRGCTRRHGRLRFWRLPRVIRTKFCSRFDYQLKRQQERFVVPSVFCDHSNYWISLAKKIGRWSGFALRCLIRLRLSCLEQNCWFFWTILAFLRQQYVLFFFFFFGIQTRILCITFAINTSNAFIINTVNIVTLKMIFFFFYYLSWQSVQTGILLIFDRIVTSFTARIWKQKVYTNVISFFNIRFAA